MPEIVHFVSRSRDRSPLHTLSGLEPNPHLVSVTDGNAAHTSRSNTIIDCFAEETFEPGMTVTLVARRHGVAPDPLFTRRRLVALGGLAAAGSGEEVVPASDYRTFAEPSSRAAPAARQEDVTSRDSQGSARICHGLKKTAAAGAVAAEGRFPMKTVRGHRSLSLQPRGAPAKAAWRRIRPPYRAVQHPFFLADLKRIAKAIGQQLSHYTGLSTTRQLHHRTGGLRSSLTLRPKARLGANCM